LTFRLTTILAMAPAIERAKAANLLVQRTTVQRMYRVTNRDNGKTYTVNFFVRKSDRARFAHCTCPATTLCKHIACSAGLNVMDAIARREAARIAEMPQAA
jgi:uncharacterized Zn finger protein